MLTYKTHRILLHARHAFTFTLPVVCLDAAREIPDLDDRFNGVASASQTLVKFLIHASEADWEVIQAGVWAIEPNYYNPTQIQQRLTRTSAGPPAISLQSISEAKAILTELQIPNHL